MPLYKYNCTKCHHYYEELAKPDEMVSCPKCEAVNKPKLPSGAEQIVMETKDAWRGVKVPKGLDKDLKRRMNEHTNEYEMPEMIEKHGMEAAKRNGWLKKIKKI